MGMEDGKEEKKKKREETGRENRKRGFFHPIRDCAPKICLFARFRQILINDSRGNALLFKSKLQDKETDGIIR